MEKIRVNEGERERVKLNKEEHCILHCQEFTPHLCCHSNPSTSHGNIREYGFVFNGRHPRRQSHRHAIERELDRRWTRSCVVKENLPTDQVTNRCGLHRHWNKNGQRRKQEHYNDQEGKLHQQQANNTGLSMVQYIANWCSWLQVVHWILKIL